MNMVVFLLFAGFLTGNTPTFATMIPIPIPLPLLGKASEANSFGFKLGGNIGDAGKKIGLQVPIPTFDIDGVNSRIGLQTHSPGLNLRRIIGGIGSLFGLKAPSLTFNSNVDNAYKTSGLKLDGNLDGDLGRIDPQLPIPKYNMLDSGSLGFNPGGIIGGIESRMGLKAPSLTLNSNVDNVYKTSGFKLDGNLDGDLGRRIDPQLPIPKYNMLDSGSLGFNPGGIIGGIESRIGLKAPSLTLNSSADNVYKTSGFKLDGNLDGDLGGRIDPQLQIPKSNMLGSGSFGFNLGVNTGNLEGNTGNLEGNTGNLEKSMDVNLSIPSFSIGK